ncbi:hypothetical protein GCM10020219_003950 [Nonomuraea dietziae]
MGSWQLQEAKQRFSEVVRKAHDEGPQIITRHGDEVAVILDMAEYRRDQGRRAGLQGVSSCRGPT